MFEQAHLPVPAAQPKSPAKPSPANKAKPRQHFDQSEDFNRQAPNFRRRAGVICAARQNRLARLRPALSASLFIQRHQLHLVTALQAMRGLDLIGAVTLTAELGDLSRFASPRELMAYLGLVPSERSTGHTVKRGPITKAGNRRARRMLVEAAWCYRWPARISKDKLAKVEAAPKAVQEVAWKAQVRLSSRFRALTKRGKRKVVVATAIARELAGFIWAVARVANA
jgi:transposase